MTEALGPTLVTLDPIASAPRQPYGIITADKPGTRQFDDGISVTPLPSSSELYQVNVFAVDTSELYNYGHIVKQVIQRRESQVSYDERTGAPTKHPMLQAELTKDLHFSEKSGPLGALVVSFTVGTRQPLSEPTISFGKVEVVKNYPFNAFGGMCRDREQFKQYGRAAALILKHLTKAGVSDMDIYNALLHVPRDRAVDRGLNINRAFMIAANHLTARTMRSEARPAIYRTNCPEDGSQLPPKILPPGRFSAVPGPHLGMGLDVYTRITSPLRRAEDFVMQGQLRRRAQGRAASPRDIMFLSQTIASLNQAAQERQLALAN